MTQHTTARPAMTEVEIASGSASAAIITELGRACDVAEDTRDSFVILRIRGCLPEVPADPAHPGIDLFTQWERVVRRLERTPAITIAVCEGVCGWFESGLLLATDHRIAGPDLRLSFRDGSRNVVPTMGLFRLAVQIGIARSRPYVYFGAEMTAQAARDLGIVDVIAEDLNTALQSFIDSASACNADDLAIRRRLLSEASYRSFEDALGTHLAARERMVRKLATRELS
jgi:isomerase DpgB